MYSVVLVMALAGSAEAPDCHHGCSLCGHQASCGCYGGGYGGCYGGCMGVGCYGACTGYAGCYGGCSGVVVRTGCYGGCVGYSGCAGYGGCVGCYGGGVIVTSPKTMPKGEQVPPPQTDKKDSVRVPTPGTIVVTLPANAKLSIDGFVSTQTSAQRRLVTPAIQPGQEFTYTLVAEFNQNGQPVSQSQRVTVRPGQTLPVNFSASTLPIAASR